MISARTGEKVSVGELRRLRRAAHQAVLAVAAFEAADIEVPDGLTATAAALSAATVAVEVPCIICKALYPVEVDVVAEGDPEPSLVLCGSCDTACCAAVDAVSS